MLKNQKLILCFSFIISLFLSFQILATEKFNDGEEEGYTPSYSASRDNSLKSFTKSLEPQDDPKRTIETALSPTVQYLGNIPEQGIKAGAAVASAVGSVLSTQSLPASVMEALYEFGALNNVPQDGAIPLVIAAASGGLPIALGVMGTYDAVVEGLKTETPEVIAAKLITNERQTSRLERWTYSVPTKIVQFCFVGIMMFAYYLNLEYRVDGWGNTRFGGVFSTWGIIMGAAILFVSYAVICRATSNPNKNQYLFNKTPKEREDQTELLQPGQSTALVIQDKGLTPEVREVAQAFNIVSEEIKVSGNVQDPVGDEDRPLMDDLRNSQKIGRDESPKLIYSDTHDEDAKDKYRYEIVLENMGKTKQTLSRFQEYWEWGASGAAYYLAPVLQSPSLFIKPMFTYAFFDQLTKYCGGSPELAMGIGIGATIGLFTNLALSTLKEIPLTYAELRQLFRLYKPRRSVGSDASGFSYAGGAVLDRLAPLVARSAAFLCVPVTLKIFLVNEVLIKTYGIKNVPLQNFIIAAFFVGTVWPATAQTFDTYVTRISNWLEMGAPVTWPWCCTCNFKLFPCVDRDGTKATLFALQNQIGDHSTSLESFGPKFTRLALEAANQPSTSPLLVTTEEGI